MSQSYKFLEVIIIYDDTNYSDLQYLKKLFKNDNRVKIHVNEKNLGAGLSRNIGLKLAAGDYIAFLDADDFWKKDKLEIQINFMKK